VPGTKKPLKNICGRGGAQLVRVQTPIPPTQKKNKIVEKRKEGEGEKRELTNFLSYA
jgi:hypothetical protein